ncbi:MAG TPA: hypothetical protein VER96_30210 [Polyangiaceae bacterium]|nr:hypothetical protein [Polyangiaceae bacterium]
MQAPNRRPIARLLFAISGATFLGLGCGGRALFTPDPVETGGASGSLSTGGTVSAGNSSSSGGTSAAGGTSAGSGSIDPGEPLVNACGGAQLLFVIPRTMVQESKYEGRIHYALIGTVGYSGALQGYWGKLDVGVLFFARSQIGNEVTCPIVNSVAPAKYTDMQIGSLMISTYKEFEDLPQAKVNSPLPEAIAAAVALLKGRNRHLVLITTGAPDRCLETDGPCAVDPSIKAVQDANELGITTHVIGTDGTDRLNAPGDDQGYETYLAQLANAGVGKPVKRSAVFETQCRDKPTTATYSDRNGDARAYRTQGSGSIDAGIIEILKSICP